MGWAEHRIEEIRQGRKPSWMELRALEHAQPVHLVLAVFAAGFFGYGLWEHNWPFILGGTVLGIAGHLYCWLWRPIRFQSPRQTASH